MPTFDETNEICGHCGKQIHRPGLSSWKAKDGIPCTHVQGHKPRFPCVNCRTLVAEHFINTYVDRTGSKKCPDNRRHAAEANEGAKNVLAAVVAVVLVVSLIGWAVQGLTGDGDSPGGSGYSEQKCQSLRLVFLADDNSAETQQDALQDYNENC